MYELGKHYLVELWNCNIDILKDPEKLKDALVSAAKEAKATIVEISFPKSNSPNITGMVIIAESHLFICTCPEYAFAAVDIFTCGDLIKPEVAANFMVTALESKNVSCKGFKRGILELPEGHEKIYHKHPDAKPVKSLVPTDT